jgi:hypothetical protein
MKRRIAARTCAVTLVGLLAFVGGCRDTASPVVPPLRPFTGERYELVALDGQALPAPFEFDGYTYLLGAATIDFMRSDTLRWELGELTAVSPEAPTIVAILGDDGYQQPARDSVEVGASNLGAFRISPWAYGRRVADTLTWRTVDPMPSDPRVPDVTPAPLGVHAWRYVRQK